MSRTKLVEPGAAERRREEKNSAKKRMRHDFEATETAPRSSSSRRSAPAIRVAGGGIPLEEAQPPQPLRQAPKRSLSQPAYVHRAGEPPGRPTWANTVPAAQFQVVHPASQHPHSQKAPSRPPLTQLESTQAPSRPDFAKFAYSGPRDPSQAPPGRRLTLPPATSRSTSARPSFTAQGAEYRNVEQTVDPSQRPSQLELGLSQIVEQSRAKLDSAGVAKGSQSKKRKKRKNDGPKKVDLSVPETGSWVRGVWVPDDAESQDPSQDHNSNQPPDGHPGDRSKGTTDDPSPRRPPSNPNPSTGNLSFDFDRSIEIRGRPESQLPPGRQPQREASSSVSNRRQPSSQPHPSYASPVVQASASAYSDRPGLERPEPLFHPYDSQDEPSQDHPRGRYREQAGVYVDHTGHTPGSAANVPSSRAPVPPDEINYEARQETPPVFPPPKTTRSSRSERTYSTRLPTAYTHRPRGADEDQDEVGLDDGISYNQDLIRRRRRTTVDPAPSTQPRPRNTPHDSDDPFGHAPEPSIRRHVNRHEASRSSARGAREEQFQDEQDVEGEEEVDEFIEQTSGAMGYLPVHDDYQANTATPTPGQRLQNLPEHQHQVVRAFDTYHPSSFDSTRMLPLTERLALDPNRRYAHHPTQSPGPDGHTSHRRRSHSSHEHRDKRSPRRHAKHYHDRPYKWDHAHRHNRCHDHRHQGYSDDSDDIDDISPRGRLRMSRHESAGLHIDKYVENSCRHHSDPTQSRSPLVLRNQTQSAPRRKLDPKTRAAQRVSRRLNMSPIKTVTGEDARKIMLERSNLDSHPISKHLLGAASKDRQRARLEGLTGIKRKIRRDKENTVPRSAPARYTFQRPSSVAGDDGELVQATQSTIGEFPTQRSVTEIRRPTVARIHRAKVPQLTFIRRSSPESPPRALSPGPVHQAGPSRIEPEHQALAPHVPSQQTPTPLRPATPLNGIIPLLTRLPIDAIQAAQTPKTPQRPAEAPKTPTSAKSARDQARARRDAVDKAMVDAMLTPEEAEKLAREISPGKEAPLVGAAEGAQEAIEDFEMADGEKSATETRASNSPQAGSPSTSHPVPITPSKAPTVTNSTAGPSRSHAKTMTREAISDTGQEMRELLKKLQSTSPSKQSSGSGPGSSKGKHDRSRRKKTIATPNVGQYQRQAKLPSFMQKILPDGPPVPTQAAIRPTQVPKKTLEEEFEVKLKETTPLLITDLPSSNKKRLGKHLIEDLPGSGSGGEGSSHDGKNSSQKNKVGSLRLGLGMPGKQNTQSKMVNSLGSQFGKTQFSQAVTRPYKDPTTSKTPRMVQEDREKALTPTQRSLGPSHPGVMDEHEEYEEEDELIDDDDDDYTSAPFVHPLHKTTTPRLQRSLAEAPLKNRGGSRTMLKTGTASGFVAPKPVNRVDSFNNNNNKKKVTPATQETYSLGLSGARDILTQEPDEMISDDDEEEDYGSGYDETEPSTGLDHHLGLAGPSSKTGREGNMQWTWWK